jgi:hypothetical protein
MKPLSRWHHLAADFSCRALLITLSLRRQQTLVNGHAHRQADISGEYDMWARLCCWLLTLAALTCASTAQAEDGYDAWLRYARLNGAALQGVSAHTTAIVAPAQIAATRELQRGIAGMTGRTPPCRKRPSMARSCWPHLPQTPLFRTFPSRIWARKAMRFARPPCGARPSP